MVRRYFRRRYKRYVSPYTKQWANDVLANPQPIATNGSTSNYAIIADNDSNSEGQAPLSQKMTLCSGHFTLQAHEITRSDSINWSAVVMLYHRQDGETIGISQLENHPERILAVKNLGSTNTAYDIYFRRRVRLLPGDSLIMFVKWFDVWSGDDSIQQGQLRIEYAGTYYSKYN